MSGKKGNDKGNQSRQDLAALRDARDAARMRVDYVAPPPQPHPNEQVTDDVKDKDKDKEREREKARKRSAHEEAMHVPAIAERYGLQSRPIGKGPDSEWVAGIVGGGPALPQATTASSEGGGQALPDATGDGSTADQAAAHAVRGCPVLSSGVPPLYEYQLQMQSMHSTQNMLETAPVIVSDSTLLH